MTSLALRNRRQFLASLAALGGAGLLGACTRREPLLRVGSNLWPGYEFLYVAQATGMLSSERVRIVRMGSATLVLQALAAGQIEAAGLTLDEVLTAVADGVPLKVIAVLDASQGADAVFARPELTTPGALRGKRICVEKSAVGAVMLDAFLKHARLAPGEVVLHYSMIDQQLETFRSGKVDAVVTFSPVAEQLESLGAVRLFDSKQVPGRILDVLCARTTAVQQCPEALRLLVSTHFAGLASFRSDATAMLPMLAKGLGIEVSGVPAAFAGIEMLDLEANREWLGGSATKFVEAAQKLQAVMRDAKLLGRAVDVSGLADPSFLSAAVSR